MKKEENARRKERRYTEGQKRLLAFDPQDLDDDERELLRRVLLPRTKYLPQTDEEGKELALQMLKEEKFGKMLAFIEAIRSRYGEVECRWTRGNHLWELFYSVRKGADVLCRFGICFNVFNLIITFGKKECERFEAERDSFPRCAVQWTYDMAVTEHGRKNLMFDPCEPGIRPYLFRLLDYKRKPLPSASEN